MEELDLILADQDGVISRWQALAAGLSRVDVSRKIRRREWTPIHPGVYVKHTGPLTWQQRAWAAVLYSWPAVLSHGSAVRAGLHDGLLSIDDSTIDVAVDRGRKLVAPDGVRLHRIANLEDRARWHLQPPSIAFEDAVLDTAASKDRLLDAVGELTKACGTRKTTAAKLLDALGQRQRIAGRQWLASVLRDIADGTCSVLEHGYLVKVERAHGLPPGSRQKPGRASRGGVFRDVVYDFGLIVELDGRAFHESTEARDRDLDRDLDAAVESGETIRLGYGQVFARPCAIAERVAAILQRCGWPGVPVTCPSCPR
jgi:hypothetical protein